MNQASIYSKTGKGVQEASGKTSQLSRGDRAILSAIDGKISLRELSARFDRTADEKFYALIRKMDADGFIREVSPGTVQRGAANAPRPPPPKAPPAQDGADELDFTNIFSVPARTDKQPVPKDPMVAAREAAEARVRAAREAKAKADAAAKSNVDSTQQIRMDAEMRAKAAREAAMQAAAEGKTKAEIEARTRAEGEAKVRAAAEARAKAEAAANARRDAAERAQQEAEELRRKVEQARRAREDAERRAREEAERTKREAEERSRRETEDRARNEVEEKALREADELRRRLDEERKAREEAERRGREERDARDSSERKEREEQDRRAEAENQRQIRLAREAEDRKRREADARKKKEEEARRWEQEDARRKSDDGYRQRAEQEDRERAEREVLEAAERAEAGKKAAEAADALSGSLLADLDSFSARQDEERKGVEEAQREADAEAARQAQEERAARERAAAERKAREEEERARRQEEERRAQEDEEKKAREAEEKKAGEAKREARDRAEPASEPVTEGDVSISRSDMGMDDASDDDRKLSPEARKALRRREREVKRARGRGDQATVTAAAAYRRKQPVKWGRPVAAALFFALLAVAAAINFLPLSTAQYEKLASDALGAPVKIGSARMWVLTGVQMRFERVSIGESAKIAQVRGIPELGALLGEDKVFSRLELEGVVLQQEALAGVLQGGMKGRQLRTARVVARKVRLEGPFPLPALDVDARIGGDGSLAAVRISGERITGQLVPRGAEIVFEATVGSFALPFLGKLALADVGMKGTADRKGMTVSEFDARLYDGTLVGNARLLWGAQWSVQGQVEARNMNAAVFAPQLVSEGRFDGRGRFAMSGPDLARLHESARLDGSFSVSKGALGSIDLSRALQSTSAQASGRTPFTELKGKGALANGALALRDMELASGLLRASGALDIEANGRLSGRINAELRTLRATLYIGGRLTEPQLRR